MLKLLAVFTCQLCVQEKETFTFRRLDDLPLLTDSIRLRWPPWVLADPYDQSMWKVRTMLMYDHPYLSMVHKMCRAAILRSMNAPLPEHFNQLAETSSQELMVKIQGVLRLTELIASRDLQKVYAAG